MITVIYVTYFKHITIVYFTMGCQKTCGEGFLYIKIFLSTLYMTKAKYVISL